MPRGNKEAILKYTIPLPPLEIQKEIVRILDNITELTAELETKLTVRRKQYEYYCDWLLNPSMYEGGPSVSVGCWEKCFLLFEMVLLAQ